jgi:pentatricopeptide repeat protein
MDQTIWLGPEGEEDRFLGKARLLASDTIVSVGAAVEGLNRGTLKCTDDFCIAYSMSNQGYYLLYKRGLHDQAAALAHSTGEARATVSATMPTNVVSQGEDEVSTTRNITTDVSKKPGIVTRVPPPPTLAAPGMQQASAASSAMPFIAPAPMGIIADAELSFSEIPSTSMCKAEELLAEQLRRGMQSSEDGFDSVITAVGGDGAGADGVAKAEEWLWKALEMGTVPGEASFNTVVLAACRQGAVEKAEDVLMQMLHNRLRPSKEIFDVMIRMFSERGDALKVEEWLLNAGQSGWTPEPAAFESVVMLYAQIDAAKAEEWLSRAQQTEYRLPDTCFDVVVRAFLRVRNPQKANEWLSRMHSDGRSPSENTLQEAVSLLIESGDVPHAEIWLSQLANRSTLPVDTHCLALYGAAMRAGDLPCAERQLEALGDTDPERTQRVVMAHASKGDAARAKAVLERYRDLGGSPTREINLAMLSTCAAAKDRDGAEAVARMLADKGHFSREEVPLLHRAMGDEQASRLLKELGLSATAGEVGLTQNEVIGQTPQTQSVREGHRQSNSSSHGGRSPSAKASAKGPVRRGGAAGRNSRSPR